MARCLHFASAVYHGMTKAFLHTNFNSSRLVRFLADLELSGHTESRQDFAERLGQWLNVADAIAVASVLPAGTVKAVDGNSESRNDAIDAAVAEYKRIRSTLVRSITDSSQPERGGTRIRLPVPRPGSSADSASSYAPFHRFYVAHQRDMDQSVAPLRASVRAALAGSPRELRQLASIDAAFDTILGGREYKLLGRLPLLLEVRFEHLLQLHRAALPDGKQCDDPVAWLLPGAWMWRFCQEMQTLLLAELDVRLLPVTGLLEASGKEVNQFQ